MKTTRSAIYRWTVTADCECRAYGEYSDPAYKQETTSAYHTCQDHKGVEAIGKLLLEVVKKESAEYQLPAPPPPPIDEARRLARATPVDRSAPTNLVLPRATEAPTKPVTTPQQPLQPGQPTVVGTAAGRAAGQAPPKVAGEGKSLVRRLDPMAAVNARRPGTPQSASGAKPASGLKVAAAASSSLNIDEEPEDRRITKWVENSGLLDEDDEGEGDDGDDLFD